MYLVPPLILKLLTLFEGLVLGMTVISVVLSNLYVFRLKRLKKNESYIQVRLPNDILNADTWRLKTIEWTDYKLKKPKATLKTLYHILFIPNVIAWFLMIIPVIEMSNGEQNMTAIYALLFGLSSMILYMQFLISGSVNDVLIQTMNRHQLTKNLSEANHASLIKYIYFNHETKNELVCADLQKNQLYNDHGKWYIAPKHKPFNSQNSDTTPIKLTLCNLPTEETLAILINANILKNDQQIKNGTVLTGTEYTA